MTRYHRRPAPRAIAIAKTQDAEARTALLVKWTALSALALVALIALL
ncbi:hypothetical protein [Ensifer soli]